MTKRWQKIKGAHSWPPSAANSATLKKDTIAMLTASKMQGGYFIQSHSNRKTPSYYGKLACHMR